MRERESERERVRTQNFGVYDEGGKGKTVEGRVTEKDKRERTGREKGNERECECE